MTLAPRYRTPVPLLPAWKNRLHLRGITLIPFFPLSETLSLCAEQKAFLQPAAPHTRGRRAPGPPEVQPLGLGPTRGPRPLPPRPCCLGGGAALAPFPGAGRHCEECNHHCGRRHEARGRRTPPPRTPLSRPPPPRILPTDAETGAGRAAVAGAQGACAPPGGRGPAPSGERAAAAAAARRRLRSSGRRAAPSLCPFSLPLSSRPFPAMKLSSRGRGCCVAGSRERGPPPRSPFVHQLRFSPLEKTKVGARGPGPTAT